MVDVTTTRSTFSCKIKRLESVGVRQTQGLFCEVRILLFVRVDGVTREECGPPPKSSHRDMV